MEGGTPPRRGLRVHVRTDEVAALFAKRPRPAAAAVKAEQPLMPVRGKNVPPAQLHGAPKHVVLDVDVPAGATLGEAAVEAAFAARYAEAGGTVQINTASHRLDLLRVGGDKRVSATQGAGVAEVDAPFEVLSLVGTRTRGGEREHRVRYHCHHAGYDLWETEAYLRDQLGAEAFAEVITTHTHKL